MTMNWIKKASLESRRVGLPPHLKSGRPGALGVKSSVSFWTRKKELKLAFQHPLVVRKCKRENDRCILDSKNMQRCVSTVAVVQVRLELSVPSNCCLCLLPSPLKSGFCLHEWRSGKDISFDFCAWVLLNHLGYLVPQIWMKAIGMKNERHNKDIPSYLCKLCVSKKTRT